MQHLTGFDRHQAVLFPVSINEMIPEDNVVRVIDTFADSLDFEKLGFDQLRLKGEGRYPYHPADLMKLYTYGYLNRYRSSRMLEAECTRLVEHPFGTIKRQWGFDHVLTKKGIKRASADVGLMMLAYNFRRLFSILGPKGLKAALRALFCRIFMEKTAFQIVAGRFLPLAFSAAHFQSSD